MTYREMREVFRHLAQLDGRYSVTDALQVGTGEWTVGVMARHKYAYRFTDLATFERTFPHLALVYAEPRLYALAEARLSWLQVLYLLGWAEQAQPQVRVQGLLRNAEGGYELVVATEVVTAARRGRSGLRLLHTLDDAERLLTA